MIKLNICMGKYLLKLERTLGHIKYVTGKSSVAHDVNSGRSVDKNSVKIVRHVTDSILLDVYERLEIIKGNNLINNNR